MSRTRRRADRIKREIPIVRVLSDLGYSVRADAGSREQQFSCDLHGDGKDIKPSARAYPSSNSWYCFGCDKTRDAIETVRDKLDLGFSEALTYLEKRYGLDALPWEDGDADDRYPKVEELPGDLKNDRTFEEDARQFRSLLDSFTKERDLPMDVLSAFWEGFDKILWMVEKKLVSERKARAVILRMKQRLMETVGNHD